LNIHCKQRLSIFQSPAGMSLAKLDYLIKFNYARLGRVWLVTSRLWTGKSTTFFTVFIKKLVFLKVRNEKKFTLFYFYLSYLYRAKTWLSI
jgi:hypothetical protein